MLDAQQIEHACHYEVDEILEPGRVVVKAWIGRQDYRSGARQAVGR